MNERKKILIIGSSGFIGKNIKEYLQRKDDKYEIFTPSSKELDVSNESKVKEYLKENYFDVVIHSAVHNTRTNINRKQEDMLDQTLRMFFSFEKNQKLYGKMLYFGSGAEYDKTRNIKSVEEKEIGQSIPKDSYGFAKYIINNAIRNSSNIYNLRLFGIYGRYEDWKTRFISNACCKVINNIPISIRKNVYFDYLFIDDFCKIIEWFINNIPIYRDYNITNSSPIDLKTIAEKILDVSNKKVPIYVCTNGLDNEYTASNSRLKNEMLDIKFTDINIAIKNLYGWYYENKDSIDLYSLLYQ